MPVMSAAERLFCLSGPWRWFTHAVVLPWALHGARLRGDLLELGCGSGAMAEGIQRLFPDVRLTLTDIDPRMVAAAARRFAGSPQIAAVATDAIRLPFRAGSFDMVTSYLMLHHVVGWETAVAESARVLRPGGVLIGYDLVETRLTESLHWADRSPYRLIGRGQLEPTLRAAGLEPTAIHYSWRHQLLRFAARKPGSAGHDTDTVRRRPD